MLNVTNDAMRVLENASEKEISEPDTYIRINISPDDGKTFNFTYDTARPGDTVVPGTDEKTLLLLGMNVARILDAMSLDFAVGPDGDKSFIVRGQA